MIEDLCGPRTDQCRRLEDLADRQIELRLSPRAEFVDDPESRGHVLHGRLVDDDEATIITLDNRSDNVAAELAAELRRIGQHYLNLAGQVEHSAAIATKGFNQ